MTASAVIFSSEAEAQLDALYEYIAANSGETRADAFVTQIISFCRGLAAFPERGTERVDLRPDLRVIGFRRRVAIAFTSHEGTVVILGVYYGGQNYEAILRDEDTE